jgi:hypothetical protein
MYATSSFINLLKLASDISMVGKEKKKIKHKESFALHRRKYNHVKNYLLPFSKRKQNQKR